MTTPPPPPPTRSKEMERKDKKILCLIFFIVCMLSFCFNVLLGMEAEMTAYSWDTINAMDRLDKIYHGMWAIASFYVAMKFASHGKVFFND